MLRMSLGVLGLVVVQVDEQGIELGEPADQPAMAEEAVLGQVDIGFARELPGRIGKVGDRHRLLAPAAAEPAGNANAAQAGGVQSQGVVDGCGKAWPRLKGRHGLTCPGKRKGHGAFAAP